MNNLQNKRKNEKRTRKVLLSGLTSLFFIFFLSFFFVSIRDGLQHRKKEALPAFFLSILFFQAIRRTMSTAQARWCAWAPSLLKTLGSCGLSPPAETLRALSTFKVHGLQPNCTRNLSAMASNLLATASNPRARSLFVQDCLTFKVHLRCWWGTFVQRGPEFLW